MHDFKYYLAIYFGKIVSLVLKLLSSGANAAPGLFALKIDQKILQKLGAQLKFSIVITGTNGKTTTSRMISDILRASQSDFIHNRAGSNLRRGIVSELLKQLGWKARLAKIIGLWEVDEAVLPKVISDLKPKFVIITNLFRDQLDRYGEIDTLAKKWRLALLALPKESTVILNSDDPTVASLAREIKAKVFYFGISDKKIGSLKVSHASDATVCPYCLSPLNYSSCFVSHQGIYSCPSCGKIQPGLSLDCSQVKLDSVSFSKIEIKYLDITYALRIKPPGLYNLYNALAAISLAFNLDIPFLTIKESLAEFKPAFGRFENLKIGNKNLQILLVKNPTGFNEVIKTLLKSYKNNSLSILIGLNDLVADGRDVSWIWDVDFELLQEFSLIGNIIVAGTRPYDLALRLKYAGIKNPLIKNNLSNAVDQFLKLGEKNLVILPTYTTMLEIRKILNQKGLIHSSWKD